MGGGVGLLLIRSWVLGNEAHENRNGVLLLCLCVAKITTPIMKGVIIMFEIIVKRPGDESLFIFKTFDEFLEWWTREKEIWPEAIILDIKRV